MTTIIKMLVAGFTMALKITWRITKFLCGPMWDSIKSLCKATWEFYKDRKAEKAASAGEISVQPAEAGSEPKESPNASETESSDNDA